MQAFLYSCAVALSSTSLALAAGLWTSLAVTSVKNCSCAPRRAALLCTACLPIVTPGVVSAIALRIFAARLGLDPGFATIVLGQAV